MTKFPVCRQYGHFDLGPSILPENGVIGNNPNDVGENPTLREFLEEWLYLLDDCAFRTWFFDVAFGWQASFLLLWQRLSGANRLQ